jgi:hypothetical protein
MRSPNTQSSILTMAVFAAFAAPVSATVVTQSLGATSQSTANGVSGTPSLSTFPGYINSGNSANDLLGSGQGFAFANQNGAYAVSSYSAGIGSGQGNASLRYSIFNDSGFAQNLSMTFKIYGGSISTNLVPAQSLTGAESLSSSYAASIKVNGASFFSSSASINQTAGGIDPSLSGTDLSMGTDDGSDGNYGWSSQYITINLGTVASGLSFDVLAELSQSSASNVGSYTFDCGGGGYDGYEGYNLTFAFAAAAVSTCTNFKGTAGGFYGDPATLNATTGALDPAITFTISAAPTGVPLPGTLALGLFGLAALATSRRKK